MLEKLFESLDEKVFTAELKSNLTESFEAAVNEAADKKAEEKAEVLAEVKAAEMIETKVEEKISELEEKAEEYQAKLDEEAAEKSAELLDQVDAYLEKVVDDFMAEAQDALDESIKTEKADMIIEAMDAMITATGVDIIKITEAKDSTDSDVQLERSTEKYDVIVQENIELEKKNAKILKLGLINEMKVGLNVVEAEKFAKLADLVEFSEDRAYVEKLETIKESLGTSKKEDRIEESLEEDVKAVKEVKKVDLTTSFSHLI